MNIKDIMIALENGEKILIEVDKNNENIKNYESAIFQKYTDGYITTSKTLGTLKRSDLNYKKIVLHFLKMDKQGFLITIL
jgi:predicted DNA-binding ArsR family transcriptional regulator